MRAITTLFPTCEGQDRCNCMCWSGPGEDRGTVSAAIRELLIREYGIPVRVHEATIEVYINKPVKREH